MDLVNASAAVADVQRDLARPLEFGAWRGKSREEGKGKIKGRGTVPRQVMSAHGVFVTRRKWSLCRRFSQAIDTSLAMVSDLRWSATEPAGED